MTFTSTEGLQTTSVASENMNVDAKQGVNVKAQFGDDIRRFNFAGNASIALLKARVCTVFSIPAGASVNLFYRDEDNDLVTMTLDEELQHAVQLSKNVLRLEVRAVAEPKAPAPAAAPGAETPSAEFHHPMFGPDKHFNKKMWKHFHKGHHHKGHHKHDGKHGSPFPGGMPPFHGPHGPFGGPFGHRGPFGGPHGPFGGPFGGPHSFGGHHDGSDHEHGCHKDKLKARHVKDVTIPDGTQVLPGVPFVKTWRVRNAGGVEWPAGSRLIFISHKGDHMGGPDVVNVQGPVVPDAEVDITVNLVAPQEPGNYAGFWRMATEDGKKFGQRLWVSIQVAGNSSSSEDSGFEHVPAPSEYEELCNKVEEMGFEVPRRRIEHLLRKYGGNVNTVAEVLTSSREGHKEGHGKRHGGLKH